MNATRAMLVMLSLTLPTLGCSKGKPATGSCSSSTFCLDAGIAVTDASVTDSGQNAADFGVFVIPDSGVNPWNDGGACTRVQIGIIGQPGYHTGANFLAWLTARGTGVTRIGDTVLTLDLLNMYDVVILDRVARHYTVTESDALRDYVDGGGGLFTMTGYNGPPNDATAPNEVLVSLGAAYGGASGRYGYLAGYSLGAAGTGDSIRLDTTHPIMTDVHHVEFHGGEGVTVSTQPSGSTVTPIAWVNGADTSNADVAVGVAVTRGAGGHAFFFGDEWISYDDLWSTGSDVPQMWVNFFNWGHRSNSNLCGILL